MTTIFHVNLKGDLLGDQELWRYAVEDAEGGVFDESMPKAQGEFLVHGSCYARKADVRQSFVKVTVGKQEKVLAIFGPRTYLRTGLSDPEPFDVVPIQFKNAFGGGGFAQNPFGTGYQGGTPPQVEVRSPLITGPNDRPPVGGLGRVDPAWPDRMKRAGTYDEKWQKSRYPGMPEDFAPTYFQLGLPDQWREGFFQGNEPFSIVNMHPERETLEGKLLWHHRAELHQGEKVRT